ncbi:uncharacterized protein LOC126320424 isoform X2 [Schistocerca gregaria]|uniref:uncharacterized protein LOC126320424 isoform X2 n=1 Tax=Schistocerca gregaria TaxID=7010 RepID=UPI00211E6237|nr:uncharacterized protein LOC126320424 isoform X2 [Schistocerca gregaria]
MSNQIIVSDIQNLTHSLDRTIQGYLEAFETHVKGHFDWLEAFSEPLRNLDKTILRSREGLFTSLSSDLTFEVSSLKGLEYGFDLANFESCYVDMGSFIANIHKLSSSKAKLGCPALENEKTGSQKGHPERLFDESHGLAKDCKILPFEGAADEYDLKTRGEAPGFERRGVEALNEVTGVGGGVPVLEERRETGEEKKRCVLNLESDKIDLADWRSGIGGASFVKDSCAVESGKEVEEVSEGKWGVDGRRDRSLGKSVDEDGHKLSMTGFGYNWTGVSMERENQHRLSELNQGVAGSSGVQDGKVSFNDQPAKGEYRSFELNFDGVKRQENDRGELERDVAKSDVRKFFRSGEKDCLYDIVRNDTVRNSVKSRQSDADVGDFYRHMFLPEEVQPLFREKGAPDEQRVYGDVECLDREGERKKDWLGASEEYKGVHKCGSATSGVDCDFEGVSALNEPYKEIEHTAGSSFRIERLSTLNVGDGDEVKRASGDGDMAMAEKSLETFVNGENGALGLRSGWEANSYWPEGWKEENSEEAREEKVNMYDKLDTLIQELGNPSDKSSPGITREVEDEEKRYEFSANGEVALESGEEKKAGWIIGGDDVEMGGMRKEDPNVTADRTSSFSNAEEEHRESNPEGSNFLYEQALKENIINCGLKEESDRKDSGYMSKLRYFMKHTPRAEAKNCETHETPKTNRKRHRLFGKGALVFKKEDLEGCDTPSSHKKTPKPSILKMVANSLSFMSSGKKTQKSYLKTPTPFSSRKEGKAPDPLRDSPMKRANVERLTQQQNDVAQKASIYHADQPTYTMEQCATQCATYSAVQPDLPSLRPSSPVDSCASLHLNSTTFDPPRASHPIVDSISSNLLQKNSHHAESKPEDRQQSPPVAVSPEPIGCPTSTVDSPLQELDDSWCPPLPEDPLPWTREEHLIPHLRRQSSLDPDVVFKDISKLCDLEAIFNERPCPKPEPRKYRVLNSNLAHLMYRDGRTKKELKKK